MRRQKLVGEIFEHAVLIGSDKTNLVFLLSFMTDKALTKFHKEFLEIKKFKGNGEENILQSL